MESDIEFWEAHATSWLERFCEGGIDPWGTEFNLPAFLRIVPEPNGVTLDIGCGDGRVGALLRERGHVVVGADASATLSRAADTRDIPTVVADGACLPFRARTTNLVVSSMVLMDVDDLHGHVAELARVTASGGSVCVAILHPIRTAGTVEADGTFRFEEYLAGDLVDVEVQRNGGPTRLRWWRRPVSAYLNAFVDAGLLLKEIREPAITDEFLERHGRGELFQHFPMFLHLRFTKP